MLSDGVIAGICNQLYYPAPKGYWTAEFPHDGGYAAMRRVPGYDVVVWRGSATAIDWLDDFDACPVDDPTLGWVHSGFLAGERAVSKAIDAVVEQQLIITGHSLGAAHSWLYAADRQAMGKAPTRIVVFGSPRPGYAKLASLLYPLAKASYKNRYDPVTGVPLTTDLFPFVEPAPFIQLNEIPPIIDDWGVLADHHFQLYLAGVQKIAS